MTARPADRPVNRPFVQGSIDRAIVDIRTWILYALALVALHTLEFVALAMPWTERDDFDAANGISSGFDIIGNRVPGGAWIVLSFTCLIGSVWATFVALSRGSKFPMGWVVGLATSRVVFVVVAAATALGDDDDRFARYGVWFSGLLALATAIVAGMARTPISEFARPGGPTLRPVTKRNVRARSGPFTKGL